MNGQQLEWQLKDQLLMARVHQFYMSNFEGHGARPDNNLLIQLVQDVDSYLRACASRFAMQDLTDPAFDGQLNSALSARFASPSDANAFIKFRQNIVANVPINKKYRQYYPSDRFSFTDIYMQMKLTTLPIVGDFAVKPSHKLKLGAALFTTGAAALGLGGAYLYTHRRQPSNRQSKNGKSGTSNTRENSRVTLPRA